MQENFLDRERAVVTSELFVQVGDRERFDFFPEWMANLFCELFICEFLKGCESV